MVELGVQSSQEARVDATGNLETGNNRGVDLGFRAWPVFFSNRLSEL
jgi:hypothetical protein